ncbi:LOW QUALITY PROTEIN: hypothetical protein U9M48_037600 [Paspalum notatum var. saurae]|uniref:Uncharacterized protein n=1 Tax=Paspalum notatum var. saurae TaxID=547442 RepID=A0AAQ3UJI1_PASNO
MNSRQFLNMVTEDCSVLCGGGSRGVTQGSRHQGERRQEEARRLPVPATQQHGLSASACCAPWPRRWGGCPLLGSNCRPPGPPLFGDWPTAAPSTSPPSSATSESKILCGDTCTPSLTRVQGPAGAIPITVRSAAVLLVIDDDGDDTTRSPADEVYDLYNNDGDDEPLFQELNYNYGHGPPVRQWTPLPPPPFFHEFPAADITADAVVGSAIYVSSTSTDTVTRAWKHVAECMLPFAGKAEHVHVPELNNLWFGSRLPLPPPLMATAAAPARLAGRRYMSTSLGSGRFCVVNIFDDLAVIDPSDLEGYEKFDDGTDEINYEFAVLTGVEVVVDDSGGLRMIKHKSRYHIFRDRTIKCVLCSEYNRFIFILRPSSRGVEGQRGGPHLPAGPPPLSFSLPLSCSR